MGTSLWMPVFAVSGKGTSEQFIPFLHDWKCPIVYRIASLIASYWLMFFQMVRRSKRLADYALLTDAIKTHPAIRCVIPTEQLLAVSELSSRLLLPHNEPRQYDLFSEKTFSWKNICNYCREKANYIDMNNCSWFSRTCRRGEHVHFFCPLVASSNLGYV